MRRFAGSLFAVLLVTSSLFQMGASAGSSRAIPVHAAAFHDPKADTGNDQITAPESRLVAKATAEGSLRILVSTPGRAKQQGVLSDLGQAEADVLTVYDAFPIILVDADAATVAGLASDARVTGLQEDIAEPPSLASSVPLINGDDMQALGFDGSGTVVAILDTGIDVDHPFFAGRIVSQSCYSNAAGAGGNVSLCPNGASSQTAGDAANAETAACINVATNLCYHGTHVAGIAAGNATGATPGAPGDGVAPDAGIMAIQVFTRFNTADFCSPNPTPCVLSYNSDQLLGLQRVAAIESGGSLLPRHVVSANESIGGGGTTVACDTDARKPAIDALVALNIATTLSAGNNGFLNAVGAPACISTAVTVGATTDADSVASFSNRGSLLDLFAPGVAIDSSIPNNSYGGLQGTSMAAPHVAGAWAVLREAFPTESVAQILDRLETGGVPISYSDGSSTITTPRIDLLAAANNPRELTVTKDGTGGGNVSSSPAGIDCGPTCEATFDEGTVVTLTATPNATSSFDGWAGAGCAGTGTCEVTMSQARSVSATFTDLSRELTVTKDGTGGGNVSSSPAGIDCGPTCEATFDEGTVVTLTATPNATSSFDGWAGAGCAGTGTCEVTMSQARSVSATFTDLSRELTVTKDGTGGGNVSSSPAGIDCGPTCEATFDEGTVVTLTATPNATSSFDGWAGAGCAGTGTCEVTMSQARSVSATFTDLSRELTVTKDGTGGGNVSSSPAGIDCGPTCEATFDEGTVVTLTATPNATSSFDGWAGAGCAGTGTCEVTMSQARSVSATFTDVSPPGAQPDALIAKAKAGPFKGGDLYNQNANGQTVSERAKRGSTHSFFVSIENDGSTVDSFTIDGSDGRRGLRVRYLVGGRDVTARVVAGTYLLEDLAPGDSRQMKIAMSVKNGASVGALPRCIVKVRSTTSTLNDAVASKIAVAARSQVGLIARRK